jgi:hypothetical protein
MAHGPFLSALAALLSIAAWPVAQAPRQVLPRPPASASAQDQSPAPLPDAKAFLADASKKLRSNDLLRSRYAYQERETRLTYDSSGIAVKKQVRLYDVSPAIDPDLTYRRLVSVNGAPPSDLAKRDAEQRRKEREWVAQRQREGENQREARLRKEAEEERSEQAVVGELASIFEIRMIGREAIDGRPAIRFDFSPRPGYDPRTPQGRIIKNFGGQAWVDEQDYELVRLKSEVLETTSVKFGFIVRLLKGSRGVIERRKVDGEAWLPTYSHFIGSGRIFLFARFDLDQVSEYFNYRRAEPAG